MVHLLGEPVAQRWSDEAKREIRDSRVLGTRNLVAGLAAARRAAADVLVSQSATGWYGARGDEPLDERPRRATTSWRRSSRTGRPRRARAERAAACAWRCTAPAWCSRPTGGALGKMLPSFKMGVGGPVAGGRQYVPWVHIDDVVGAMLFASTPTRPAGP